MARQGPKLLVCGDLHHGPDPIGTLTAYLGANPHDAVPPTFFRYPSAQSSKTAQLSALNVKIKRKNFILAFMRIGFYDHGLSYRGTTRAMLAYIKALNSLKNVELFHFYDTNSIHNSREMIKFVLKSPEASLIPLKENSQIDNFSKYSLNWIYYVTSTQPTELPDWCSSLSPNTRLLVHQVGYQKPIADNDNLIHAYVSHWQNSFLGDGKSNVLPYIIPDIYFDANKNLLLRESLGISNSATVLGRHGGPDTFNLKFAVEAIFKVLQERSDLHIVFAGTKKIINHPRIHYINTLVDQHDIIGFIDSCDAMLHCRWEGETYGLACAEFLARKKPIITWTHSRERNHILMADRACLFFDDGNSLEMLLKSVSKDKLKALAELIDEDHLNYYRSTRVLGRLQDMMGLA